MKTATFLFLCALLFGFSAAASSRQGAAEEKEKPSIYAELERAPEKSRSKPNPLANDPQAPLAGRILFEEHCEECHGKDAVGTKKAPSLRAPEVQEAAPGAIFWVLSNGVVRRGMPVWSKLPEPQRWQLVSYIKSLGRN